MTDHGSGPDIEPLAASNQPAGPMPATTSPSPSLSKEWYCTFRFDSGKVCGNYNYDRPTCIYCGAKRP